MAATAEKEIIILKKSGKSFVLENGETISQRFGIYVHRGDVKSGNVA